MDGYCSWCGKDIKHDGIRPHGVPYHPSCFAIRKVVLRRETVEAEDLKLSVKLGDQQAALVQQQP
jgi:hypothetical protein